MLPRWRAQTVLPRGVGRYGRTVLVCAPCGKTARYSPTGLVRPHRLRVDSPDGAGPAAGVRRARHGGARRCDLLAGVPRTGAAVGGDRRATGGISDALVPGGAVQSCSDAGGAALRQRQLVWLSDPEEFAQAYPRTRSHFRTTARRPRHRSSPAPEPGVRRCSCGPTPTPPGPPVRGPIVLLPPVAAWGSSCATPPTPATPSVRDRHRAPCRTATTAP